ERSHPSPPNPAGASPSSSSCAPVAGSSPSDGRPSGVGLEAVWTEAAYRELVAFLRERLEDQVLLTARAAAKVLASWRETEAALRGATSLALLDVVTDVKAHTASLVYPGFIAATPPGQLPHLARYLAADRARIDRAATKPDAPLAWQIRSITQEVEAAVGHYQAGPPDPARESRLTEARWMLEELRVSLFAQQLGTPIKVSDKRIRKLLES
ncbi:MAG: DUF3418 domain-containing protein, partial [Ruaniaceae bacterium]|nr:DUF3418 domain-containing protein [Ruaniaceae bacterium]